MADRWRLPESLGGGEYDEYRRIDGTTEAPAGTVAFLVDGCVVAVALALLTAVEPPLPPEPDNNEAVRAGRAIFWRDDAAADDEREPFEPERWFLAGSTGSFPWSEVCRYGTPVRLVPDPAAGVNLPWAGHSDGRNEVRILAAGEYVSVDVLSRTGHTVASLLLTPTVARLMAGAALLAAADAAEAGAS